MKIPKKTINITEEMQDALRELKIHPREPFEEVIGRLLVIAAGVKNEG